MIAFLTVDNYCWSVVMLCGFLLIVASVLMGKPPQ